ncbi:MAG: ECF transporter S component [Anaerolineaceae bacterium]|nr:ECF transporter S component [Anaerolineaceae bacterium]
MAQDRTRKLVITGALGAVAILLGLTHWGFIPWFAGISLTIMHVPVIIGAILEGPVVGAGIGLIFGLFSLLQAAIAPSSPGDVVFTNPLISIFPRLLIGPISWLVWNALKKFPVPGLIASGLTGSLINTVFVLGMLGIFQIYPWALLGGIAFSNGLLEAALSAVITVLVVGVILQIRVGKKKGADL